MTQFPDICESLILQVKAPSNREAYRRELYLRAAACVRTDVNAETWRAFEATVIGGTSNAYAAQELKKSIGTIYAARSRVMKRLRTAIVEIEEAQS